jgi:hypothetical protein
LTLGSWIKKLDRRCISGVCTTRRSCTKKDTAVRPRILQDIMSIKEYG